MTQLLRTRDVMQMLGVGRTTIYRWMEAGKFPAPVKIGMRGDNRWRLSEIEAWIPPANSQLIANAELNGLVRDREEH